MKEVEIKILGIEKVELITRLEGLGASCVFEGILKVAYFDFPDERIRKAGELLRVREMRDGRVDELGGRDRGEEKFDQLSMWNLDGRPKNAEVEISYKYGRKVEKGLKVLEELSAFASGFEQICLIFERIGLKNSLDYEKKRASYELEFAKVEIDEYPNGLCYVEVEGKSEEQISRAVKLLDLSKNSRSNETVDELFKRLYGPEKLKGMHF